ncbi:MAG: DNA polymerase II large subunit, partial [Acidobacteria bacterium]|nr:DNA polymerase II large subunit [Acidobacteriota bacterium]
MIDNANQSYSLRRLLAGPMPEGCKDAIEFVSNASGIAIAPKFSSTIAVRVGRPEKAAERKMKPPVHVLFPVGAKGGATRDIMKACKDSSFYAEIANRYCSDCKSPSMGTHCRGCGRPTILRNTCIECRSEVEEGEKCARCGRDGRTYSSVSFPLRSALEKAGRKLGARPTEPFKGVKSLMNRHRAAEPLEKGILRQKHGLYTFKDGTIRFDATNGPLTHFRPAWISTSVQKLRELGYMRDYSGRELVAQDQLVELMMQDVIIPRESADHLLRASRFIDEELTKLYDLDSIYKLSAAEDLVGHLVVGLAPHTSVGIMGRIIGFTD